MSDRYSAVPQLVVGGNALDAALRSTVARVEVDERLGLPTMVTVALRDAEHDVVERAGLHIGAPLEVAAGPVGDAPSEVVAVVEIVALEASYSPRESLVVVRAYDVSHRLHRFRRTRSYQDVTDGDVVRTVAEGAGLDVGDVDDPGVVHAHLAQLNVTDWEFLAARARECGRVLRVREDRLELAVREQATAAPEPGLLSSREPRQLVLGANLESLFARASSAELPAEVQVRGWSPENKEAILASAPVSASGTEIGVAPADLAALAGSPVLTAADRPLASQEEADGVAAALAEAAGSGFATATAVCRGDPALRAGGPVSVGLAGSVFSGRWTITAARHTFDADGYRTTLELGGTSDHTLLQPTGSGRAGRSAQAPVNGVVTGVVTDIGDDDELARVRVSLPWLSDGYVSDWVRVVHPGAGPDRGSVLLPEVEDEVLVAFEQGDVRRPYVLGGLYNGQDRPPLEAGAVDGSSGESQRRGLVSRLGHRVVLDDGRQTPGIVLVTAGGAAEIVLDDKSTDLRITAKGKIEVTGGTIGLSARKIEVTADADLSLTAPNVTVEADATLTLRGGVVRIN